MALDDSLCDLPHGPPPVSLCQVMTVPVRQKKRKKKKKEKKKRREKKEQHGIADLVAGWVDKKKVKINERKEEEEKKAGAEIKESD